jgi:UDP-glucuronate 4-epimerase
VICLDNVDNFYDPNIKFTNAEGMAKKFPDLFELITWDIRNPYHLIGIFQKTKFDFVVHLAARAVVWPSNAETRSYQDVNIRGTIVLLEACKEHGINNFVFASLSVYRENQGDPFTEEDLGIQPISPCGATKRAGELFCCSYHHVYRDGSSRRDYTFC